MDDLIWALGPLLFVFVPLVLLSLWITLKLIVAIWHIFKPPKPPTPPTA